MLSSEIAIADGICECGCGKRTSPLPKLYNGYTDKKYHRFARGHHSKPLVTQQQKLILCLIAEGLSNKEIAYELETTENSVKVYVHKLLRRVGAKNRYHLVAMKDEILSKVSSL